MVVGEAQHTSSGMTVGFERLGCARTRVHWLRDGHVDTISTDEFTRSFHVLWERRIVPTGAPSYASVT